jgi:hypothetical protein
MGGKSIITLNGEISSKRRLIAKGLVRVQVGHLLPQVCPAILSPQHVKFQGFVSDVLP